METTKPWSRRGLDLLGLSECTLSTLSRPTTLWAAVPIAVQAGNVWTMNPAAPRDLRVAIFF